MGILGYLDGGEAADDLIQSCTDEEEKGVAVSDVGGRAN